MRARGIISGALVAVAALGCNELAGINEPLDRQSGSTSFDRFLGDWKLAQGTQKLRCAGFQPTDAPTEGNLKISQGTTSDLVATSGCALNLRVTDNVAVVLPNQTCTLTEILEGEPVRESYSFASGSFSLQADGTALSQLSGAVLVELANGRTLDCTFDQVERYTR